MNEKQWQKRNAILVKVGYVPKPMTDRWVETAVKNGMLRKTDLKDGAYYAGNCRNATVARWDAKDNRFTHMRSKLGRRFPETINHPENDDGYDLFTPFFEVEPAEHERIKDE